MLRRYAGTWALSLAWIVLAAAPAAAADQAQQPLTDLYGDPLPAGARARLGTVRYRHACTAAAYSPDGKLLATGGTDNQIHLFDAATGKEVRVLAGHQARTYSAPHNSKSPLDTLVNSVGEGRVNALAFSPDCASTACRRAA
jgi:hypothetical protein